VALYVMREALLGMEEECMEAEIRLLVRLL